MPKGISCPPRLEYPPPPDPVEMLFIGWNPPGKRHFWNSREDNLYRNVSWVFEQLAWLKKPDIWELFSERRFYLTHAVKCWNKPKFGLHVPGLIELCARSVLDEEIRNLDPRTICALGNVPHRALYSLWPDNIPVSLEYGEGWHGVVSGRHIIVTCFPNVRWNRKKSKHNRQCTTDALRRWVDEKRFSHG